MNKNNLEKELEIIRQQAVDQANIMRIQYTLDSIETQIADLRKWAIRQFGGSIVINDKPEETKGG